MKTQSNRVKLKPPPGGRVVADWEGKRVELLRSVENAYGVLPVGAKGTARYHFPHGLRFLADGCTCCRVSLIVSGLDQDDVRVITEA